MGATTIVQLVDGTVPTATSFNSNFTAINNAIWPVSQGGLGLTGYTAGDIPYASAGTVLATLPAGSTNQILVAQGTTTAPTWSSQLKVSGTGHVFGGTTVSPRYMVEITGAYSVGTTLAGAGLRVAPNLTAGTSSNAFLLDVSGDFTEAGSGTHPILAGLNIGVIGITAAAASLLNTASLYIAGTMSATVVSTNYAVWIDDGTVRLDGNLDARAGATFTGAVTVAGLTASGTTGIFPAASPATPAQYALYQENLIKAWCRANTAGTILSSFNLSSVSDLGVGRISFVWNQGFATNTAYALFVSISGALGTTVVACATTTPTGSATAFCADSVGATTDPAAWHAIAIGT